MTLEGPTASFTFPAGKQRKYYNGANSLPIDRPKIKPGLYTTLKVAWTVDNLRAVGTYSYVNGWNVLGNIRYSQYNVPLESSCSGSSDPIFIDGFSG